MNITELWQDTLFEVRNSAIFQGTVFTGTLLLIVIAVLAILLCVTYLLRIFFKKHHVVHQAHKTLIYLLTMTSVLALLIAGIIGVLLPIIPGILFLFIALILMRRYHKVHWIDKRMRKVSRQFRKTALGQRYYAWRKQVRERHLRRKAERLRQQQLKIQEKLNKLREEERKKR